MNLQNDNDVTIEGVRVQKPSLVPFLLAPQCICSLVLKWVRTWNVALTIPVAPQPSTAPTNTVCSVKGRGEVVNKVPLALASPSFCGDRHCGFVLGRWVGGQAFYTARECLLCDTEHHVFPGENRGVLVLGDQYTPPMIGNQGKCIPVFRMFDANFKDLAISIWALLRKNKVNNDWDRLANYLPNLYGMGHLINVGEALYF